MASNDINGVEFERTQTLDGVTDHVRKSGGFICFTDQEFDRDELSDGQLILRIDKQRDLAFLYCFNERWSVELTICTCCPAIHAWEPFYFESDNARVGKRTTEQFPGTEEVIRVARAWVLERQMKHLTARPKGFG